MNVDVHLAERDTSTAPTIRPGLHGLIAFAELIDEPLHPFERRIARAAFGPEREVVAVLPRGNNKTTFAAKFGLHHLLTVPAAQVTIGAASRDQARICFERMRGFAEHPAVADSIVIRHLELRHEEGGALLRVIPSDGARAARPQLVALHRRRALGVEGRRRALGSDADGLGQATRREAAGDLDAGGAARQPARPAPRPRDGATLSTARRRGAVVEASGEVAWLEWSTPGDASLDDFRAIKAANPAPWIGVSDLRRQRASVPETVFAQFHAGRCGVPEGSWLPPGAWQAIIGTPELVDGEDVWVGVDVGGERSATAVVWVNERLHADVAIYHGDAGVLEAVDQVRSLAGRFNVREVVYDPWRFGQAAQELEREGLLVVAVPQHDARIIPASARLHAAIVELR